MSDAAIANVVANLRAGQMPDSSREGTTPVRIEVERVSFTITEVATFEDGSVSQVSYPDFEAMAAAVWSGDAGLAAKSASATGCSYMYTSAAITWTNCKINGADVYVNMAYRLNATKVRGSSAKLPKVYDNQALGKLGSLSHVRFGLVSSTAAQYQVIWTSVGSWASFTRTLTTKISADGALSVSLY